MHAYVYARIRAIDVCTKWYGTVILFSVESKNWNQKLEILIICSNASLTYIFITTISFIQTFSLSMKMMN